jgi:NAD-dependent histone deacetylase SIR2
VSGPILSPHANIQQAKKFSYVWLFDGAEGGTWVQDLEPGPSALPGSSRSSSGSAEDVATNGFNQREAKKQKIDD